MLVANKRGSLTLTRGYLKLAIPCPSTDGIPCRADVQGALDIQGTLHTVTTFVKHVRVNHCGPDVLVT
jgi:hypothetical protein